MSSSGSDQYRGSNTGRSVDDLHRNCPNISLDGDFDRRPRGVLHGISDCFLDQPAGRIRTTLGEVLALADEIAAHREARSARPADEFFDDAQPSTRAGWSRVVEELDQTVYLYFGFACRLGDRGEGFARFGRARLHEPLTGPGLYDHEADAMGDNVVKLARDAARSYRTDATANISCSSSSSRARASSSAASRRRELTTRPTNHGAIVTISKRGLKLLLVVLTPTVRLTNPISDGPHRQLAPRL